MTLPFTYSAMPEDYPGDKIWFTLRFVANAPEVLPGFSERWSWSGGARELVRAKELAVGDRLTQGTVVARTELGGAAFWQIRLGTGSQMIPMAMQVERYTGPANELQLEWDDDPTKFSNTAFETALVRLHASAPLAAVMFQDGSW